MNGPVNRTGSEEKFNAYSILSYLYGRLMTFVCHCQCVYSQNLTQLCHQERFCRLFLYRLLDEWRMTWWWQTKCLLQFEVQCRVTVSHSHLNHLFSSRDWWHISQMGPKEVELHMMVIFTFWWACFTSQRGPSYLKCLNLPFHCWFYMGRGALYMHRNCQYGQHF